MGLHPESDVIYFGRTNFRGANRLFGIKRNDRRQHSYIVGKTGTGKSALISNMIIQDIANGEGVCVVDPHGELVEGILEKIPEERRNDVIYFNPADTEYHIGFNVLELPDPKYKHLVASGLMGIFTKIWANVWSARMEYILNNAVLALLDTPGSTLLGIPRLLVDKEFRQRIIQNIADPVVKAFWVNEFEQWEPKFRNEAIAPIQNKVGQFLSSAIIRNVVGQSKSTIDVFEVMNSGKIFLVNVSKGRIGEDNSSLLGAMLITKIQLAAMERVRVTEEERVDFYLYVDEFQNFATDSFASILSEARKYRLNLIVAHQYIGQLVIETSTKVRDAIFGNVGTMIVFRVGAADAEFLEPEFEPEFMIQDIVNLPNYHTYLKLMVDGVTCRPFSALTLPPFRVATSENIANEIIELSRRRYARPRALIEEEINAWSGIMNETPTISDFMAETKSGPGKFRAVCSNCSRDIYVPFEPLPGKAVYCQSCLLKVKSGEIGPARSASSRQQEKYSPDLAQLGIEFEPRKSEPEFSRPRATSTLSPASFGKKQDLREVPPETTKTKPISLSELDKTGPKSAKQPKVSPKELDIRELRQEIAASLAHDLIAKEKELEAELAASEPVE
ncbi:MAG: type IV secretion system DNA-binding domain-containing protein [Patescibacteria group bacterium]